MLKRAEHNVLGCKEVLERLEKCPHEWEEEKLTPTRSWQVCKHCFTRLITT